jgi:cob(I)alamin adenosyltransferase
LKIYTRTGDFGETGLFGGPRVGKEHPRIMAYGSVDELAAALGMVQAEEPPADIHEVLLRIQHELFIVGAELATPPPNKRSMATIGADHVTELERDIDRFDERLPKLREFILPGGGRVGAALHLARTICRRSERWVVALARLPDGSVSRYIIMYLNRLGDLLFVLARAANQAGGYPEQVWEKRLTDGD